jgi:hypothetical protein
MAKKKVDQAKPAMTELRPVLSPGLADFHREVVAAVKAELAARHPKALGTAEAGAGGEWSPAAAAFAGVEIPGFDVGQWFRDRLESIARDAVDGVAQVLGPGAEAWIRANPELIRRIVGEGTLGALDSIVHAAIEARKAAAGGT